MKKIINLIAITAVGALVLAVAFVFLLINTPEKTTESVVFKALAPTDVSSVSISNSYGSFEVSMEANGYVLDDIPAELVDLDSFVAFMTQCGALSALKRITSKPSDLSVYGLDKPMATVSVSYSDSSELVLYIGNADLVSGHYYMQVNQKNDVYLLSSSGAAYFLCGKEAYINHYVTPELADGNVLAAIQDVTFSGGELKEPITIESVSAGDEETKIAALSFGAVTHLIRGRGVHELDQTYGAQMLGSILGIKAREVVGYGLTEEEIAAYGFGEPYMEVDYDLKNSASIVEHNILALVKQSNTSFLAHLSGSSTVYEIDRPAFVDIQYEKLMLRWFLSPLLLDLSGLTITTQTQTLEFTIGRDKENKQYAMLNGEELDINLFQSFYRLVTSASASDGEYLSGATADGDPLMTITYHYLNSAKEDDVMKLFKGTTRRVYVDVNGVIEVDTKESFYNYMLNACENILHGKAIDENW